MGASYNALSQHWVRIMEAEAFASFVFIYLYYMTVVTM